MTGKSRARANGEGSIFPYRNGFAAYVWVTTPIGTRQRKYVYGKTRDDVHAKWIKLQGEAARGPVATRIPSLATWLNYWLAEVVRPVKAPMTYEGYAMVCRLYIVPELGSRRLDKLTVRDVQTGVNRLRKRCLCCAQGKDAGRSKPRCCAAGRCCQQLPADWTVHQAWRVLRGALTAANREELITRNVAAMVQVSLPRPARPRPWSVDEARRFLESARSDDDPFYAGYVLLLVLGLRRGELLGLGWPEIDLPAGHAHVAWQLQRVGGELLRRQTKTAASDALLPLPGICVTALEDHQRRQAAWAVTAGAAWHDTGMVVTTRYGMPVDPRNFHRYFKARTRKAGVPVVPVHSTRRACASMLVALDVHPRVAMQILRHSAIGVTMNIYSEVSSEETRDALRRLGEHLGDS